MNQLLNETLQISKKKRILNPSKKADIFSYEGEMSEEFLSGATENGFKFFTKHQTTIYNNIQTTLYDFNMKLTYIWFGIFTNARKKPMVHFVMTNDDKTFFWRKYEANVPGGGFNTVWSTTKNTKTTQWMKWSIQERKNFLGL